MTIHQAIASPGCGCDRWDMLHPLISIDEALTLIAADATPVGRTEAMSLDSAFGRILTQPVRSRSMAPSFDNAAMDGYAIGTSALTGLGPWALRVVARVPAGQDSATVLEGTSAARIFTGAPIPKGADSVVMQEDVVRDGDVIHLSRRPVAGQNIRVAGSDMAKGATVLDMGRKLGPREDRCLRRGWSRHPARSAQTARGPAGHRRRGAACGWRARGRTDLGREHTDAHGKPCTCRH